MFWTDGSRNKPSIGFTLIEVIVAMTILSVGAIGVLGTISLALQTSSESLRLSAATALGDRLLREVEATNGPASGSEGNFSWKLSFAEKPHRLVLASVAVEWLNRGKATHLVLSRLYLPER